MHRGEESAQKKEATEKDLAGANSQHQDEEEGSALLATAELHYTTGVLAAAV